ncbi:uncharacterized protein LOC131625486 [Vicia villosa]|uniref:uncharacterized protein LOC131625486 n=1 Tax=Vicia villosa TaxID=3911 RepID=UPI00273B03F9|nr:uncharacterized protein LOC131625486 [Vicia villosa]
MASTSTSASTQRSPLQPPPESFLRDPFAPEINSPPRNYLEERVFKRRRIEETQDKSLIHGLELQQHAAKLLESNELSPLQKAIEEYTETKKETLITIFKSFALHYPNAFSFKLAKILELHPPLRTRIQTVALLLEVLPEGVNSSMHSSILIQLKNPLLHSLKAESEEIVFPMLCEMIGIFADRLYQLTLGDWEELLQYACDCISGDAGSNNKKGLRLLTELSENVFLNREFWLNEGRFDLVFSNILEFVYSEDRELKALAYNASMSLMLLSKGLRRTKICDILLPILLNIIDQHGEEEIVVDRVKRLGDLVAQEDGLIFRGKHGEVFWCMIRVAEIKNVSEELVVAAVNVLKELGVNDGKVIGSVIRNLSREEVRRVLSVSLNFLSCVDDDPLWYDVDNKDFNDDGITDPFYHGVFLFDLLSLDGDGGVFIPTAMEMITMQYASHIDWRFRHTAMLAIGWIVERNINGEMEQYFDQVLRLVFKSLDDPDPRVLWATMHTIKSLTEYEELLMNGRYHKKLTAKLVPFIRCYYCARVQRYAVIAVRSLVENCGLDNIPPFGEPIVASLHTFLNHEDPKLQEEAIDTLRLFAVLTPRTFRQKYYDTTMEALKGIVFNQYSLSRLLVFAKYLECMVYLVRKIGPDNFKEQEAIKVVESIISLEGKLSNTEHMTKYIILKALDQICRCPRVRIDKFIDKIMPVLLGSGQLCLDLTVDKLKADHDKRLIENMMVLVCNTLSYCAVRSYINFSPHISKVAILFVSVLDCSRFQVRKTSILGLPNLLLSLKVGDTDSNTKSDLTFFIVRSLVEMLKKVFGYPSNETDMAFTRIILRSLPKCIQSSSTFFNDSLIKIIADEIKDALRKIIKIGIMKEQGVGTSRGRCESLATEDTLQDIVNLIATTVETFKERFTLHADDLISMVVVLLADDNPDRLIAFAISIFNVIFPLFPDKLPLYHDRYNMASSFVLRNNYPCSKLPAIPAIGICAMFGGDRFKAFANAGIFNLYVEMKKSLPNSEPNEDGEVTMLCDNAVAALGKICEFHGDSIDPKVFQRWLNFLPLKHDFNEARYTHGLLSKLIQRSDKYLFGHNNENLPEIISVVKEILSGPVRLGTEEAINLMIDFIDQHGGMEIEI